MTTLSSIEVRCAVCGSVSWHSSLGSYYFNGSIYFDLQPVNVSPLCWRIQYCPTCHYCAPSIGKVENVHSDFDILAEELVRDLEKNGDLESVNEENEKNSDSDDLDITDNLNSDSSEDDFEKFDEKDVKLIEPAKKLVFPSSIYAIDDSFLSGYLDLSRFSDVEEEVKLPHEVDRDKLLEILNSYEYRLLVKVMKLENYPEVFIPNPIVLCFNHHILYSYICEKFEWFSLAGWYSMCCARSCDSSSNIFGRKNKPHLPEPKMRALNFFIKTILSGKSFSEDVVCEGLILVDISRRIREFGLAEKFLNFVEKAVFQAGYKLDPIQNKIIQYQRLFIKRQDNRSYIIDRHGNVFDERRKKVKMKM